MSGLPPTDSLLAEGLDILHLQHLPCELVIYILSLAASDNPFRSRLTLTLLCKPLYPYAVYACSIVAGRTLFKSTPLLVSHLFAEVEVELLGALNGSMEEHGLGHLFFQSRYVPSPDGSPTLLRGRNIEDLRDQVLAEKIIHFRDSWPQADAVVMELLRTNLELRRRSEFGHSFVIPLQGSRKEWVVRLQRSQPLFGGLVAGQNGVVELIPDKPQRVCGSIGFDWCMRHLAMCLQNISPSEAEEAYHLVGDMLELLSSHGFVQLNMALDTWLAAKVVPLFDRSPHLAQLMAAVVWPLHLIALLSLVMGLSKIPPTVTSIHRSFAFIDRPDFAALQLRKHFLVPVYRALKLRQGALGLDPCLSEPPSAQCGGLLMDVPSWLGWLKEHRNRTASLCCCLNAAVFAFFWTVWEWKEDFVVRGSGATGEKVIVTLLVSVFTTAAACAALYMLVAVALLYLGELGDSLLLARTTPRSDQTFDNWLSRSEEALHSGEWARSREMWEHNLLLGASSRIHTL